MSYVDGVVIPVPAAKREAYIAMARKTAPIFLEHGALQVVECWGDDLKHGKVTDFFMAVKAQDGENIVFSWVFWPSKEVRDAAMPKIMDDERMRPDGDMPFDSKRLIFGGFVPVLDMQNTGK